MFIKKLGYIRKSAPSTQLLFITQLIDMTEESPVLLLSGHKAEVFVCGFNPVQHSLLASGSKDAVMNLWNLPNPSNGAGSLTQPAVSTVVDLLAKPRQTDFKSLHWNTSGTLLAVSSHDSILRIFTSSGSLYYSNPQHKGSIFAARFSKSGKLLLTASMDGTFCIWDVNKKLLYKQYRCHTNCCSDVDWLSDETFAVCGADQTILIMRIDKQEPLKILKGHQDEVNQIKCSPSGTRLASCSDDMTARVWNVPGLVASDAVVILEGHKYPVCALCWCPDQTLGPHPLIATSSFDETTRLWDSVTGECLTVFSDHERPAYALTFSPNGRWLAAAGSDGWLHVYSILKQELRWSWHVGAQRMGIFEIDWQTTTNFNRIALALECKQVALIDVSKIPALQGD